MQASEFTTGFLYGGRLQMSLQKLSGGIGVRFPDFFHAPNFEAGRRNVRLISRPGANTIRPNFAAQLWNWSLNSTIWSVILMFYSESFTYFRIKIVRLISNPNRTPNFEASRRDVRPISNTNLGAEICSWYLDYSNAAMEYEENKNSRKLPLFWTFRVLEQI